MRHRRGVKVRNALEVADRFIALAAAEGRTLTPMQLLKLVYIAHGWMLGLHDEPLIRNRIEAWRYGPVIPDLYHAIKHFRDQPVRGPLARAPVELDEVENDLIDQVYGAYGHLSGIQLSALTHQPGTPWHEVYEDDSWGLSISSDLIEQHYKELASSYAAKR